MIDPWAPILSPHSGNHVFPQKFWDTSLTVSHLPVCMEGIEGASVPELWHFFDRKGGKCSTFFWRRIAMFVPFFAPQNHYHNLPRQDTGPASAFYKKNHFPRIFKQQDGIFA